MQINVKIKEKIYEYNNKEFVSADFRLKYHALTCVWFYAVQEEYIDEDDTSWNAKMNL